MASYVARKQDHGRQNSKEQFLGYKRPSSKFSEIYNIDKTILTSFVAALSSSSSNIPTQSVSINTLFMMDGIKTTVAESFSVTDAVLNLKSKAHDVRQTLAAVWNVQPTQAQPPSPEAAFSLDMKNDSEESVSEVDKRLLVDKVHFEPRGKYRCMLTTLA